MWRKIALSLWCTAAFAGFMFLLKFDLCPLPAASLLLGLTVLFGIIAVHRQEKERSLTDVARRISRRVVEWPLALLACAVLVTVLKIPWFAHFKIDATELIRGQASEELLSRRAHLLAQVVSDNFSPASSPVFMTPVMKKEWAIGTLSMTAMALTNIAFEIPETRESSLRAVEFIAERMLQDDIRSFETDWWGKDALEALDTENGNIGWLGHFNLILAAHRFLGGDERYRDLHTRITAALVRRIDNRPFPYLDTFPNIIFTADNAVVIASISLYDRLYGAEHGPLVHRWITFTKERLIDERSGGIVFYVSQNGNPLGANRGSAAGWFSFYLPFVDEEFAKLQFDRLMSSLGRKVLDERWFGGFRGVREYLSGEEGPADVDSGPVIFGLSTSGSGFAIAGAKRWENASFLQGLLNTAEAVGTSVQWHGRRCYLFAPLIGDAIMLAMKTSRPWDLRYRNNQGELGQPPTNGSRQTFSFDGALSRL